MVVEKEEKKIMKYKYGDDNDVYISEECLRE